MVHTKYKMLAHGFKALFMGALFAGAAFGQEDQDAVEYKAVTEITANAQAANADVKRLAEPALPPAQKAAIQADLTARNQRTDQIALQNTGSARVQTAASQEALQARDWTRSLTYGDRAVDLAQQKGDPQLMLAALKARGQAAWYAEDYPRAAQDAQAALKLDPKDKAAMALWQFSKGRLKASNFGKLPPNPEREKQLDDFLADNQVLNDASVKAAGAQAQNRAEAIKRLAEARRLHGMGDDQAALQAAQSAMNADPTLPDAYMERAIIFAALKQIAQSLAEVTKAIALWTARGDLNANQALAPAHGLRAELRNQTGDAAGALDDATKAIGYNPASASAYRARAQAREGLGQKGEQVLADYKRAAELDPQQAGYYEDAVARLSGGSAPSPLAHGAGAASSASLWMKEMVVGAVVLLLALIGVVLRLLPRGAAPKKKEKETFGRRALDSQYDAIEKIGEGGMGTVYKGWDKVLKRPVAIKRLRSELQRNPRERDRFIREAEMVASLRHPHIVEIYTIIRNDDEDTYLVFEYIVGQTVHQLLNESSGRHLPAARALEILRQIAEAVDHAHAARVIHRDLKPANVMIADGGWVKVMDFGIARQIQDSLLTTTNTIVGTPTYMAPEQAMGAVVKQSDVYALGCTLYEMLTGGLPFKGPDETRDKLEGRFLSPSLLVPDLPAAIDPVLAKALAPRAEDRYRSCLELYQAAAEALNDRVTPMRS